MATMPTDPTSPTYACDMATWLREQYFALLSGGAEKVIRYRGPNGEREVQYTQANLGALQQELSKWENLCYNSTNAPRPARFAIRAGSMRTTSGGSW